MQRLVKPLVSLVVLVAIVGGGYYAYTEFAAGQSAAAAAAAQRNVQYATVTRGALSATVSAVGAVVPSKTAKLSFRSPGVLQTVNVRAGDTVKAGDVLARLDTVELELALATAMTNLDNANIKLRQASSSVTAEDARIAKANLDKVATALAKAQSDYDKVAWMSNVGITPQAAALQNATLDYQIALANYAKATKGVTDLDVALLQNSVKLGEIQVETAKRNLANAAIVAPIDGVVTTVGANAGEQVSSATVMFNIIDLQSLRIDASVDETDAVKLAVGQQVTVTLDTIADLALPAVVSVIAPNATTQSGVVTYLVQMTLGKSDPRLRSGLTATASVIVQKKENVLMVPNRAIRSTRSGRTVLVRDDGTSVERQVAIGMSNDSFTEITAGVNEGEEVVISTTATNQPLSGASMGGGGFMSQ